MQKIKTKILERVPQIEKITQTTRARSTNETENQIFNVFFCFVKTHIQH